MMKKLPYLGAILFALAFTGGVKPAAAGDWGALATSPNADFGYSYNYEYKEDAEFRALQECRKNSNRCQVKGSFQNTCVTVFKAGNGAMGWAWGHGKEEDASMAEEECNKQGGKDCTQGARFCTGNP